MLQLTVTKHYYTSLILLCLLSPLLSNASADFMSVPDPTKPDPFPNHNISETQDNGWDLQMISIQNNHKYALINNQFVVEGDTLGAYRVRDIEAHQVYLQGDKDTIVLSITPGVEMTAHHAQTSMLVVRKQNEIKGIQS
jgi:hypothetical protein